MDPLRVLIIILLVILAFAFLNVHISAGATGPGEAVSKTRIQSPLAWAQSYNKWSYFHHGPARIVQVVWNSKMYKGLWPTKVKFHDLKKNTYVCAWLLLYPTKNADPNKQVIKSGRLPNCSDFVERFTA